MIRRCLEQEIFPEYGTARPTAGRRGTRPDGRPRPLATRSPTISAYQTADQDTTRISSNHHPIRP